MAKTKKLVRDKIPEIIFRDGQGVTVKVLDWEEWDDAIWAKIKEELRELRKAMIPDPENGIDFDAVANEAADVQEAFNALISDYISLENLERRRQLREEQRGGFKRRLYLEEIHKRGL